MLGIAAPPFLEDDPPLMSPAMFSPPLAKGEATGVVLAGVFYLIVAAGSGDRNKVRSCIGKKC